MTLVLLRVRFAGEVSYHGSDVAQVRPRVLLLMLSGARLSRLLQLSRIPAF